MTTSAHNASTFTPYDPVAALGDVSPTAIGHAKGKHCGLGQLFLTIIAVAVWAVTGSPVLASIVSQEVGVATGIQDKFSWNQVALAGITAEIGGALNAVGITNVVANAALSSRGDTRHFRGGARVGPARFIPRLPGRDTRARWPVPPRPPDPTLGPA